jgi:uncharacterized membrane protein
MTEPSSPSTLTTATTTATPDEKLQPIELVISGLLRAGVILSLGVIVFGTTLSFVHHSDYVSSPRQLRRLTSPGAAFPRNLREVIAGVRDLRGQAIVVVGLLLLIATPVLRVAVSIVAFLLERDGLFAAITAVVLALLLLSFVLGKVEG